MIIEHAFFSAVKVLFYESLLALAVYVSTYQGAHLPQQIRKEKELLNLLADLTMATTTGNFYQTFPFFFSSLPPSLSIHQRTNSIATHGSSM